MVSEQKPISRTKTNLLVDFSIFIAFLVATAPRFSGLAVHEWLGIAFGAAIITHLLLHWEWIVAVTRRFIRSTSRASRINYVLNTLLFIDVTMIIFTGIMISRIALPALNIEVAPSFTWRRLHGLASDGMVLLLGFHVALHWSWIVNAIKRYLVAPIATRWEHAPAVVPTMTNRKEIQS